MNYIEFSKTLISLTEDEAIKILKEKEVSYCIRTVDGKDVFFIDGDIRPKRVLLEIEKGIVTKAMVS